MLPNFSGFGGLVAVVVVMIVVLILYASVGVKADARAKWLKKRNAIQKAAELNFNTVEEYEEYLESEMAQEKSAAITARQEQKRERKQEKRDRKQSKKQDKQAGQDAAANSQAPAAVGNDINSIMQDIDMNDIQQLIADGAKADPALDMDVPNAHMEEQVKRFVEDTVGESTEPEVGATGGNTEENSEEQTKENTAENAEEQAAGQAVAEQQLADMADEVMQSAADKRAAEAVATAESAAAGANSVKPAQAVKSAPKKNIIDESGVDTGNGETIGLEDLKAMLQNAKADGGSEEKSEPKRREIESAPYVHSIPKILNTKEAIAVSQNAPKVTTFYPDGKVMRDNRLMEKRSFYQDENLDRKAAEQADTEKAAPTAAAKAEDSVQVEPKPTEQSEPMKQAEPVANAPKAAEPAAAEEPKSEVVKKAVEPAEDKPKAEDKPQNKQDDKAEKIADVRDLEAEADRLTAHDKDSLAATLVIPGGMKGAAAAKAAEVASTAAAAAAVARVAEAKAEEAKAAAAAKQAREDAERKAAEEKQQAEAEKARQAEKEKQAMAARAEENSRENPEESGFGDILMPEKPKAFGYNMAWLAIPNMGSAEVLKALGLKNIAPSNWTMGLTKAYEDKETVFVTPVIHGWTLVIGKALWEKIDLNQPIEKISWLQKLADSFLEVFYFTTAGSLGNHGWFYIKDGLLVRAYGFAGELDEVMWNYGPLSQEEYKLIKGFAMGKAKVEPTEKDVLALAAAWSVDTSFTNDKSRPDIGFVGSL